MSFLTLLFAITPLNSTGQFLPVFTDCMTGPVISVDESGQCDVADADGDLDVDLRDFAYLQVWWKCAIPEGCNVEN